MAEGERILGIVYNADGQVGRLTLPKTYDLIFTDRRLVGAVVAKTGAASLVGGVLGGVIGGAIAGSIAKRGADTKRLGYANLPLENIAQADKANFAAPYESIENAKIKGLFKKRVVMKVEGKKAVFVIPKAQVEDARRILAEKVPGAKV